MTEDVHTIAYVDDLAVVARKVQDVKHIEWIREHRLDLAPKVSEAVLLVARNKARNIDIFLNGHKIAVKKEAKCSRVILNRS